MSFFCITFWNECHKKSVKVSTSCMASIHSSMTILYFKNKFFPTLTTGSGGRPLFFDPLKIEILAILIFARGDPDQRVKIHLTTQCKFYMSWELKKIMGVILPQLIRFQGRIKIRSAAISHCVIQP